MGTVTAEDMQAAQAVTLAALAAWLILPRVYPPARAWRGAILVVYLVLAAALVARAMLR